MFLKQQLLKKQEFECNRLREILADEINVNRPQNQTNIDETDIVCRHDHQQKQGKESGKQNDSQMNHHSSTKNWILRAFTNHHLKAVNIVETQQNKKESACKIDQKKAQEYQSQQQISNKKHHCLIQRKY